MTFSVVGSGSNYTFSIRRPAGDYAAVTWAAAHGIAEDRWNALVPTMARQALASGSPANNPRVPDEAEIAALYARVFRG